MIQTVLPTDNVLLNVDVKTKDEAIRLAGNLLVKNGYVKQNYIEKMMEREESLTTYMGNFIAIPHGTEESKQEVISSCFLKPECIFLPNCVLTALGL